MFWYDPHKYDILERFFLFKDIQTIKKKKKHVIFLNKNFERKTSFRMRCKSFKTRCYSTHSSPFFPDYRSTSKVTGMNCNKMLKRMNFDLNSCCLIVIQLCIDYLNEQCEINRTIYNNNIDLTTIWYPLRIGNGQKMIINVRNTKMNMNQQCNNHPCTFCNILLKSEVKMMIMVVMLTLLILQWLILLVQNLMNIIDVVCQILLIKIGYSVNGVHIT